MAGTEGSPEVRLAPEDEDSLKALFEGEFRHRRAFVPGRFDLTERQACSLVLVHPRGGTHAIGAEAVYVKPDEPGAGVGLELTGLDPEAMTALAAFVNRPREALPASAPLPRNAYERIRQLTLRERDGVARQGNISDRVALERTFGSSVWEALLQNPQLSVPEVAHIAKNGTLPVPLVSVITANSAWLAAGEVRRALLGNPRVNGPHLERVLRATPRNELRQLAALAPCRTQVRALAKRLVGE